MSMEKVGDRWKNNKKIYVHNPHTSFSKNNEKSCHVLAWVLYFPSCYYCMSMRFHITGGADSVGNQFS